MWGDLVLFCGYVAGNVYYAARSRRRCGQCDSVYKIGGVGSAHPAMLREEFQGCIYLGERAEVLIRDVLFVFIIKFQLS